MLRVQPTQQVAARGNQQAVERGGPGRGVCSQCTVYGVSHGYGVAVEVVWEVQLGGDVPHALRPAEPLPLVARVMHLAHCGMVHYLDVHTQYSYTVHAARCTLHTTRCASRL